MENSCDILITNTSAVIPKVGIVECDIAIENGKIKSLKPSQNTNATRKINAAGKYVLPGVIDPHVHYGVYTPIDEAATTESRSGAIGGVTTMMRMLRLYDDDYYSAIDRQLAASGNTHYIDYAIHASILKEEQVKDIPALKRIGINSFKIYMNLGADLNHIYMDLDPGEHTIKDEEVNMDDTLMSKIIEAGSREHSTILVHAENPTECSEHIRQGKKNGLSGLKAWSDCRPPESEAESVARVSALGRKFGANLYFVHIGSNAALDSVLTERQKGNANYYIETCPQYLTHTYDFASVTGKVVPPIRSKSDVQSIWSALKNGIIDTVGTDHVANRHKMKVGQGDLWSALAGFPGIATMLPVLLDQGINENRISIERLAEVTSYNAARIFGMYPRKGTIELGSDADLVIVDIGLEQKVSPELLQSFSDYTIYDGWKLRGWPIATVVRGKVVMEQGQVMKDALGHGKFIART